MDTPVAARPVLVGVDGSTAGTAGLCWAAEEACRRSVPLQVVHVLQQRHSGTFTRANPVYVAEERREAELVLDAAVAYVRGLAADVEVRPALEVGSPAVVLLAQAAGAEMVVVGSRGRGGFTGLLTGSVAAALAAHASCPVVVVRGPGSHPASRRPVVVGVDASPTSDAAVAFAFAAAAARRVPLVAVHAWDLPVDPTMAPLLDFDAVDGEERTALAERVAGWAEKYPDVSVRPLVVRDRPARVLVAESDRAQLVVVGSRGHGGVRGMLLGSVSQALLHHAPCPVAVVRAVGDGRGVPGDAGRTAGTIS